MDIPLDIKLLSPKEGAAPIFLSVGYGNAHIVIELNSVNALEKLLAFIGTHREERGSHWVEIGRFVSSPVTFSLNADFLALIIGSDLDVDGFGQSAGLYIPRELLDSFTDALAREHGRFTERSITKS